MPTDAEENIRILLVEDDESVRQAETSLLVREGFSVISVDNGPEALGKLGQGEHFDLILLDLELKGEMDGLEVCRAIKKNPKHTGVPVMFVTGQIRSEIVAEVFKEGGDEFIAKPFRLEELLARTRVMVRKGREERWLIERARKLAEKVAERDDELDDLRRFAQDIVSSLPSALLVIDAQQQVIYVNAPFLECLGVERREIIGRSLSDFARPECLLGPIGSALETAAQTGQGARFRRIAGFLKERGDCFHDVALTAIDYAGSRQILLVLEDVTEQARADAAVATERGKLEDIVNAMNAALCLIDRDRTIVWKNRTFDLWFGDTFGQPGRNAFLQRLAEQDGWVDAVFEKAMVRHMAWNVYTAHGQRRFFANIIAPIKGSAGPLASQALVLTQDVTEQETRVEQLSLLRNLSQHLQHTLDKERLNHIILLCVSAGHALGFNRAFLFKHNKEAGQLQPVLASGPTSQDEAHRIWAELANRDYTLLDMLRDLKHVPKPDAVPLFRKVRNLRYALTDESEILVRSVLEKKAQVVADAHHDPRVSGSFRETFECREFVVVPMIVKDSIVGAILADNLYSNRPITDEHVKLLSLFAGQAALALANADTFAELQMRMAELRSAQEQIIHSEKLAAVGRMAAHVAHEIRNPLSTIGGFARAILKRANNPERVAKNAEIIVEESTRLECMLKDVMDFSRPSEPIFKKASINALVEKAFRTHADLLKSKGILGRLELTPDLPTIEFDENQMLQVLQNLIRNSVEAMPKGGELVLYTQGNEDVVMLALRDTGQGIPEKLKKRLFNPFVTSKTEGTGLGLAVTKKIVDDHGGTIGFESREGEGATFQIGLPIRRSETTQTMSPAPSENTNA